jgi:hypothetical protein
LLTPALSQLQIATRLDRAIGAGHSCRPASSVGRGRAPRRRACAGAEAHVAETQPADADEFCPSWSADSATDRTSRGRNEMGTFREQLPCYPAKTISTSGKGSSSPAGIGANTGLNSLGPSNGVLRKSSEAFESKCYQTTSAQSEVTAINFGTDPAHYPLAAWSE